MVELASAWNPNAATEYLEGLDDDVDALISNKVLLHVKEMEFWQYWAERNSNDVEKVKECRDQLAQMEYEKNMKTPKNLSRDYFDQRNYRDLGRSFRAQLERAKILHDDQKFEFILSEAKHWTKKIYEPFWDTVTGSPDQASFDKLNEMRKLYGI